MLEEEITDKIMGPQYDKTVKNKSSNGYEWKSMGNYYWPLDEPISPLSTSSNGNLWGERTCV